MKLARLTFILTDDCNYNCTYCVQEKGKNYLEPAAIEKAAVFFHPFFNETVHIPFYGGEPLLAFAAIRQAVSLFNKLNKDGSRDISFSLTTNGSLLDVEMLAFFKKHRFGLTLSFDGLAQESCRRPGSMRQTAELIDDVRRCGGIDFSVNSVFTPETVGNLAESLQIIMEAGCLDLKFELSTVLPWDDGALRTLERQLETLHGYLLDRYKEKSRFPVGNFRSVPRQGCKPFICSAGRDRLALAPDETLWGCFLLTDFFRGKEDNSDYECYCFGTLTEFMEEFRIRYPKIRRNYNLLRQNLFFTDGGSCSKCDEVNACAMCPANAAQATGVVGKIPPWLCRIHQITKRMQEY